MNVGSQWKSKDLHLKLLMITIGVFMLAILQDFIYSKLKLTGFYLSESVLYNTYWMFFLPFIWLYYLFNKQLLIFKKYQKIIVIVLLAFIMAVFHAFIFTGFFTGVSNLIYEQPHRYQAILKTVLSNQFYLTVIIYIAVPFFLLRRKHDETDKEKDIGHILLKNAGKIERISTDVIVYLKSDKPYISIVTTSGKHLDSSTLQGKLQSLDPEIFIRVHRSTIINKDHVVTLISRKNGDFDAKMSNGDEIRLSRHYRSVWKALLH